MSGAADAVFLTGCKVVTGGAVVPGMGVLVEGGLIRAVLPESASPAAVRRSLPPEGLLAPGLIDIQVNGGGGVLFNDAPSLEGALHIAAAHRRLGTTGILPTLITSEREVFARTAAAAREFVVPGSGCLGVHFEGPFLSKARPGVHLPGLMRAPDDEDFALLRGLKAAIEGAVLVTVAPECAPAEAWHRLARAGVVLSAGHSVAGYEEVGPSVTGVTHLFNAMEAPGARAPGLVAAALLSDRYTGVIVDGVHVHPAMLRLMMACKAPERVVLVSDSMAVAGTDLTEFVLQGRRILRRDGGLTTADGVLAGADLSLAQAVRNAVEMLGVSVAAAVGMASANAAEFLGIGDRYGRIAAGKVADMVLFDAEMGVAGTWLEGKVRDVLF
jgi:N-acetylglucosamine-6-phosphate deacetylase